MRPHRMNPTNLQLEISCSCGPRHRLVFNPRGQLCLLDHVPADRAREEAWLDLGGEPFTCSTTLQAWQQCMTSQHGLLQLPAALRPYAQDCFAEHKRRAQLRRAVQASAWSRPVYERATFLERILNRLLTTHLGLPADRWLTVQPAATGWLRLAGANPQFHEFGYLGVQRDWIDQVYRTGLAVVEGGLTVCLLKTCSRQRFRHLLQVVPARRSDGGICFERRRLPPAP